MNSLLEFFLRWRITICKLSIQRLRFRRLDNSKIYPSRDHWQDRARMQRGLRNDCSYRNRLERLRTLLGLPIPPHPDGLLRAHAHPRIQLHRLGRPEPRHHRRDEAPRRGEQPPLHRRLRPAGRAHPRRPHRADHPHGEPRLPLRRQAQRRGAVDPLPPGHHAGAGLLRHRLRDGPLQPGRAGPHLRPQRQRRLRPQPLQHLPGRRRRHRPDHRHRLVRRRCRPPPHRVHLGGLAGERSDE